MKSLEGAGGLFTNPAALYLASLGTEVSRRGMISPLNRAALFLDPGLEGNRAWQRAGWDVLSAPMVRSIMAATPGSPATRKKALAALKGVARSAWEMGQLQTEVYQRIRGIKSPRGGGDPTGRHIFREEVDALVRACSQDPGPAGIRDQALVWVVYATGARRAELGTLRLGDLGEDQGKLKVSIRGKGNRQRSVYMEAVAASDLLAWRKLRGGDVNEALFCAIRKGGAITGNRISTTALDKILARRVAQAGLKDISWHDFRRTAADNLLDSGVDIATVAKIFGHANIETTARYDRRGERAKIKAAGLVGMPANGSIR